MEKDFFKDRHPNCRSMKAVQEAVSNQTEVYICEKIMQTVAETLHDLTRVLPIAILSNDDHPMGLKVKGLDSEGRIKIGRITYFIFQNKKQEDCILTKKGLIPIEQVLYKNYYYFYCYFKIPKIKNYTIELKLEDDLYFYKKEQMEEYLKNLKITNIQMYPQLIQIYINNEKYNYTSCNLQIFQEEKNIFTYKNIRIETLFKKIEKILGEQSFTLELFHIERKQVL